MEEKKEKGSPHISFLERRKRVRKTIHEDNSFWSASDIPVSDKDREEFLALLEKSPVDRALGGEVVKGRVLSIADGHAVVDIGLKTEGRIPLKEFETEHEHKPNVGDTVEVFLESAENALGDAVLSREKVRYKKAWSIIEAVYANKEVIEGLIVEHVRGGFIVELEHVRGFLPGSQADLRPVRMPQTLVGTRQKFHILKLDKNPESVIVSRRSLLEEGRKELIKESLKKLKEGEIIEGVVKNLTNYGAFVDLNGFDGLLHVADMSWRRIAHPSELLSPGDKVRVKVVRISPDFRRVSLGIKQLEEDPWKNIESKYKEGQRLKGNIVNIEDYGAFVEVEPGVEGLVHVSEMSWGRKNIPPSQLLSTGQEVDVQVLKVDQERRRISLGMRQCHENPWELFAKEHSVGSIVDGKVRNTADFGIFVALDDNTDGLVHISDVSWETSHSKILANYKGGDAVKVQVLSIDTQRGRISLGIKQLTKDPYEPFLKKHKKGDVVTCVVQNVTDAGIDVCADGFDSISFFIKRQALSSERSEQDAKRFHVGEKVDAMISDVKQEIGKVVLSIRALEEINKEEAVKRYGSEDSGASLRDILMNHFDEKGQKKVTDSSPESKLSAIKTTKTTKDSPTAKIEVFSKTAQKSPAQSTSQNPSKEKITPETTTPEKTTPEKTPQEKITPEKTTPST